MAFQCFSNGNTQNMMKLRSHESNSYPLIREVKAWQKGIFSEKLTNIALKMAFQCFFQRKYAKYDEITFP